MTATLGRTLICGHCARGYCERCPVAKGLPGAVCSCEHSALPDTVAAAWTEPPPVVVDPPAARPDPRTLATRLIALRVLKDRVAQADAELRAEFTALALVGDRTTAALGDTVVGHVQLTKGRAGSVAAAVEDEQALTAWVAEHYPTEVETTTRVRRAFLTKLLDGVRKDGAWADPQSGELVDLPGVTVSQGADGAPTLAVKPTANAATDVPAAWADGRLQLVDLTALSGGPS